MENVERDSEGNCEHDLTEQTCSNSESPILEVNEERPHSPAMSVCSDVTQERESEGSSECELTEKTCDASDPSVLEVNEESQHSQAESISSQVTVERDGEDRCELVVTEERCDASDPAVLEVKEERQRSPADSVVSDITLGRDSEESSEREPTDTDLQVLDEEEERSEASQESVSHGVTVHHLPNEVLLKIFGLVKDADLCRLACVDKRFNYLASDVNLWKALYRQIFEYDLLVFRPKPGEFVFKEAADSGYQNPWKESFKQFNQSIHVYPNESHSGGYEWNRLCFSSPFAAVQWPQLADTPDLFPTVFVHPGDYQLTSDIVITSNLALIGAGSGNFSEKVRFHMNPNHFCKPQNCRGILITDQATRAYLGHFTVIYTPLSSTHCYPTPLVDVSSYSILLEPVIENLHLVCKERWWMETPTVPPNSYGVRVTGMSSSPTVRNCHIEGCAYGIFHDGNGWIWWEGRIAGTYEGNTLTGNATGLLVDHGVDAVIRGNTIKGQTYGIHFRKTGSGVIENNEIEGNSTNIMVSCVNDPVFRPVGPIFIRKNKISRGYHAGIVLLKSSHIVIEHNEFSLQTGPDVQIEIHSQALLRRNVMDRPNRACISSDGSSVVEII